MWPWWIDFMLSAVGAAVVGLVVTRLIFNHLMLDARCALFRLNFHPQLSARLFRLCVGSDRAAHHPHDYAIRQNRPLPNSN